MISYDILQNLENNCFELLNATTGMISGSNEKSMGKSHQNIVRALRKIVIANEMMGKGIICISGLQGAGKSTLMKNFYGLSDEYFNIKTGVGEKIPVFICENGECKGPEMYAMTLEKQDAGTYIRKNVKMNAEDFRNASSGEETNLNIMYEQNETEKPHSEYVQRKSLCQLVYKKLEDIGTITAKQYQEVLKKYPLLSELYALTKEFCNVLFSNNPAKLDEWINEAQKYDIPELQTFINGIKKDLTAVKNGIIYSYNNGLAEGSVNKIKVIKRIMYGRNSFELLKAKVLFGELFHVKFN